MLGERIRQLRKQKRMTLEELAGKELTKGMLSLIENNKANPSMESLRYIAEQLGIEVADLLEEISSAELREILDQTEKLYNTDLENRSTNYKQIIDLIELHLANLTQGYEAARLLDIYSRCLYNEKIDGWSRFSDQASKIYDHMNLTSKRTSLGIFRAMEKFVEHDYMESLTILLGQRAQIEATHVFIDSLTRLDLDYHEAILHLAVGDSNSATRVIENALAYSKEHRIFYRMDDLYRLAAGYAMITKDEKKQMYYSKKLKLYGELTDDMDSIIFYNLMNIDSLISEKQDFVKALEKSDQQLSDPKLKEPFKPYFYLQKGKALYGLFHYKEALYCLEKIRVPSYLHHPMDLSLFYVADSFKAMCHLELRNWHEARQSAKIALENFGPLPQTPYKDFATETYNKIEAQIKKTKLAEEL